MWTFILRRATALADPAEAQRVSAAIPTVQRSGYAIGAAYVGVIANSAGLEPAASPPGACLLRGPEEPPKTVLEEAHVRMEYT